MKKMISWNVNGLRACVKKGFLDFVKEEQPDILCLQEIKLQEGQIELDLPGYYLYWNYAEKKGYSGTALFTKEQPLTVHYGVGEQCTQEEGRIITAEYETYYVVTVYTPNAQRTLARLPYRLEWEDELFVYLQELNDKKPVIYCGDLNVAHQEIDLKNARPNRGNSGFTEEERAKMTRLLSSGFTDSFRALYPKIEGAYSWWSYLNKARERNIGWRIDYFIVSDQIVPAIEEASIATQILGSDHCPVQLTLNTNHVVFKKNP